MRWYFATRKQYHHQFGPYAPYFDCNLVSGHSGHLIIDEHGVALAHGHKSQCLLRRRSTTATCASPPQGSARVPTGDNFHAQPFERGVSVIAVLNISVTSLAQRGRLLDCVKWRFQQLCWFESRVQFFAIIFGIDSTGSRESGLRLF